MPKTLLPEDFPITDNMRQWANEKVPTLDIDYYHEDFCNHWRGNGKKMASWIATWYTWMRRTDRGSAPGLYGPDDKSIVRKRPKAASKQQSEPTDLERYQEKQNGLFDEAVRLGVDMHEAGKMTVPELQAAIDKRKVVRHG